MSPDCFVTYLPGRSGQILTVPLYCSLVVRRELVRCRTYLLEEVLKILDQRAKCFCDCAHVDASEFLVMLANPFGLGGGLQSDRSRRLGIQSPVRVNDCITALLQLEGLAAKMAEIILLGLRFGPELKKTLE